MEIQYCYVTVRYDDLNQFLTFCRCIPNLRSIPPRINLDDQTIGWGLGAPGLRPIIHAFYGGRFSASWASDALMAEIFGGDWEQQMKEGIQFAS